MATAAAHMAQRSAWTGASFALLIAVWAIAAWLIDSRFFPAPLPVFERIAEGVASGELPYHVGITLARVGASSCWQWALAAPSASPWGRREVDRFFDGWLILFLNMPALVTIILCYIWFGLNEAAAVLAVAINKIPDAAVTLREGARAIDRDYHEMASVFDFGAWKTFPQCDAAAAHALHRRGGALGPGARLEDRAGRGAARPLLGLGFQLYTYFQLFESRASSPMPSPSSWWSNSSSSLSSALGGGRQPLAAMTR